MRKIQILMWTALTVTGILAGCSNSEEPDMTEQASVKTVTIRASIADGASSRIALGESDDTQTKVSWSEDDAFALTVNGTPYTFTLKEGTEDVFTYTGNDFPEITSETAVTATYPVKTTDIAYQTGSTDDLSKYMTLTASASISSVSDITLNFEHSTSVMKLVLSNDDFKNKTVSNLTVDLGGTTTVTTNGTFTGNPEDGKVTAYVVVSEPTSVTASDVTLFAECNGKTYSASLTSTVTLTVGKLYTVTKSMTETTMDYLTFTAGSTQTFRLTDNKVSTLQYSVGGSAWVTLGTATVTFGGSDNGDLRLRGISSTGTATSSSNFEEIYFGNSVNVACTGDIRTLVDYTNYKNADTSNARFCKLFKDCTVLTTAPLLPATDLASYCYYGMFWGCTALTSTPTLPATTLASHCYNHMFNGCKALTSASAISATTLANNCCYYMFGGCTALTYAPALSATTLADYCYQGMFEGCTALTETPELPATTLAYGCYYSMFGGCTALTKASALPATELANECYIYMFSGCTALTEAPVLPAAILANKCYQRMFSGSSNLSSVTMLATDVSATDCLSNWLYGAASSGTLYVTNETMKSNSTITGSLPSGWTVMVKTEQ